MQTENPPLPQKKSGTEFEFLSSFKKTHLKNIYFPFV